MDAYEKLKEINTVEMISEEGYNRLLTDFPNEWLADIGYEEQLSKHRKKGAYMNEVLRLLETPLREIQHRPEMRHIEDKMTGYVPTQVTDVWDRDDRLKSEYEAILIYCKKYNKDVNATLFHMAEYRGLQKLYEKIRSDEYNLSVNNQNKPMPKNFETEIKKTYDTQYLKIFLRHGIDHEAVSAHISSLPSVRKSNVTKQISGKIDLTVYPAKAYDISETKEEVELTLDNYFKGNKVDPQFVDEPVSSVSEKAYFQVIDFMLDLGKNLEGSKRLTERFDEERYRDYFIPYLNTISKNHSATAESFHREGKTDILFLNEKGEPVLIAECKLWKGEKLLLEAIDQLLKTYVNWRDEKIALVIFNRDNKKFTEVIETATKAVESHPLCLKAVGKRKDTSFSYLFRHPDDEKRTIKLELVLFNFV